MCPHLGKLTFNKRAHYQKNIIFTEKILGIKLQNFTKINQVRQSTGHWTCIKKNYYLQILHLFKKIKISILKIQIVSFINELTWPLLTKFPYKRNQEKSTQFVSQNVRCLLYLILNISPQTKFFLKINKNTYLSPGQSFTAIGQNSCIR